MLTFSFGDLKDAARGLRRTPTIALSAITCLALGLAATTDVFSAVSRALLEPLPFHEPDRLVAVYRTTPTFNTGPFSAPVFEELARGARQVRGLAAVSGGSSVVPFGGEGTRVSSQRVTGAFFEMLGARPVIGRLLTAADITDAGSPVVVISEELWQTQLNADPRAIGSSLTIDGVSTTIVGVLPRFFRVPIGFRGARGDLWLPLRFTPNELGQWRSNQFLLVGRLAPGVALSLASQDMDRMMTGIIAAQPQLQGEGVRLTSLQEESTRGVERPLLLLLGAVLLVLLIAAVNVASLLLARAVHRRRETAVRVALGGGRWDVMRPVVLESVLLTVIGLVTGVALAWAGLKGIGALAAARIPQLAGLSLDLRVIGFTVALSLVVAVLCGAIPAWRGTRVDPQEALRSGRGGGADRTQRRLLNGLVIAEVGLSFVLLVSAGLVLRGFTTLLRQDPGFDPSTLLTLEASVPVSRYADGNATRRFLEPALTAVRALPGVASAASISLMPYDNWGWNSNVRYEGVPGEDPAKLPVVEYRLVSPEFFAVTSQRLIAGRLLNQADDDRPEAARAVVANQALVDRDFKGQDPIGKRFHLTDTTFATIVGVVSDIRNFGPYRPVAPEFYMTYQQLGAGTTTFPIVVRARGGDVDQLISPVRNALRQADAEVVITKVRPMPAVIGESVGQPRFYLTLLGAFAGVAVVLALAGVYGVMSYAVAQRTREFGIRSALGSAPRATIGLVTREGMSLVGFGLIAGIVLSYLGTGVLRSQLYGVSPLDVAAWASATALLVLAGLAATLLPARRSARVDPMTAIRSE